MTQLQPFAVQPGEVRRYLAALECALDGTGPALLPYADQAPSDVPATVSDGIALVMSTSGSTGTPKRALLSASALIASADATHERLGGPGQWLLPMPAQHIAGTQVLIRSLRARQPPVALARFSVADFQAATARLTGERTYTSLVPTQLRRLLDAGGEASLRAYDGILLGGAASPASLLTEARERGVHVLTTYGMSETAGGCVYDGIPLRGTRISLAEDGRITLAGPTIAEGYLGGTTFGPEGFRTDDIGELTDGRLRVLGRIDDLINTGGLKVAPRVVEDAISQLPEVREVVVLALPDEQWGQVVAAAVRGDLQPEGLRDRLRAQLPAHALPRRLLQVQQIPVRGPGKPDRLALAAMPGWQNLT